MVSYLYRMPAGIPGEITRSDQSAIEAQTVTAAGASGSPAAYGVAVMLDSGTGLIRSVLANDIIASVYGWLVRPYPTNAGNEGLGVGTPANAAGSSCNVLRRGYLNVFLARGTAVKGAPVFVRRVADTGKLVGDIETTLDNISSTAIRGGGNTGNGTMSAVVLNPAAKNGVYRLRMLTATTYSVTDPDGYQHLAGATGVAYVDDMSFTLTAGGTPFVAGDGFDITVVQRVQPVPRAFFMGAADGSGNVEISYVVSGA